jgi:hypothetical protein
MQGALQYTLQFCKEQGVNARIAREVFSATLLHTFLSNCEGEWFKIHEICILQRMHTLQISPNPSTNYRGGSGASGGGSGNTSNFKGSGSEGSSPFGGSPFGGSSTSSPSDQSHRGGHRGGYKGHKRAHELSHEEFERQFVSPESLVSEGPLPLIEPVILEGPHENYTFDTQLIDAEVATHEKLVQQRAEVLGKLRSDQYVTADEVKCFMATAGEKTNLVRQLMRRDVSRETILAVEEEEFIFALHAL